MQLPRRYLQPGPTLQASEEALQREAGANRDGVREHQAGRQMAGRLEWACGQDPWRGLVCYLGKSFS